MKLLHITYKRNFPIYSKIRNIIKTKLEAIFKITNILKENQINATQKNQILSNIGNIL